MTLSLHETLLSALGLLIAVTGGEEGMAKTGESLGKSTEHHEEASIVPPTMLDFIVQGKKKFLKPLYNFIFGEVVER